MHGEVVGLELDRRIYDTSSNDCPVPKFQPWYCLSALSSPVLAVLTLNILWPCPTEANVSCSSVHSCQRNACSNLSYILEHTAPSSDPGIWCLVSLAAVSSFTCKHAITAHVPHTRLIIPGHSGHTLIFHWTRRKSACCCWATAVGVMLLEHYFI